MKGIATVWNVLQKLNEPVIPSTNVKAARGLLSIVLEIWCLVMDAFPNIRSPLWWVRWTTILNKLKMSWIGSVFVNLVHCEILVNWQSQVEVQEAGVQGVRKEWRRVRRVDLERKPKIIASIFYDKPETPPWMWKLRSVPSLQASKSVISRRNQIGTAYIVPQMY